MARPSTRKTATRKKANSRKATTKKAPSRKAAKKTTKKVAKKKAKKTTKKTVKKATKKVTKNTSKKAATKTKSTKKTVTKPKAAPTATKAATKAVTKTKTKAKKAITPKNTETMSYSQGEFYDNIAAFCGFTKRSEAKDVCTDIANFLTDAMKRGYKVPMMGLGKMYVRKTKARMGRNPATGEAIKISAKKRVRFTASKALKDAVLK